MDKVEQARNALNRSAVLEKLKPFSPELVSTIFVGLDTDNSDIDIICSYEDEDRYVSHFKKSFSLKLGYALEKRQGYILGSFIESGFEIEVYASTKPTKQQLGYRHYKIMERLVLAGEDAFCRQIKNLKQAGYKTEPAICHYLSLSGDPYLAILQVENWPEPKLEKELQDAFTRANR